MNYFRSLSLQLATAAIIIDRDVSEAVAQNRKFYQGDHWQDGLGWMGPIPAMNDKTYLDVRSEIQRAFCSKNAVREVITNQNGGVLGKEVGWSFVRMAEVTEESPLTKDEIALLGEVNSVTSQWWDERGIMELLKTAHDEAAIGERVCLRIYVPRGRLIFNENTKLFEIPKGDFEQQMNRLFVQLCLGDEAGEILDEDLQVEGAAYSFEGKDGANYAEIVFPEERDGVTYTIMRVFAQGKDADDKPVEIESEFKWELGGNLTIRQLKMSALITQQIRENQMSVNLQKTLQNRNGIAGGFLERLITDGMPPGQWVQDPAFPDDASKKVYKVSPFKVGAGTVNFIQGYEYQEHDDSGNMKTRYGSPNVHFREPIGPETFIEAKRDSYQDILEECGQQMLLMSGDATASGESRKQARTTFENRLKDRKKEFDPLIKWLLETVVTMALLFAGRKGALDGFACNADCIIDTGPLTAEEQKADGEAVKAGRMSVETAMSRDGIEDPPAEMNRIQGERKNSFEFLKQQAEMILSLVDGGFDLKGAALFCGVPEEIAAKMAVAKLPVETVVE